MTDLYVYSMRDRIADRFRSVVVDVNDAVAKRNFSFAVNNTPELLFQSKDLELCCIAEFDSKKGTIVPIVPIKVVCRGDEVITDDK